MPTQLYPKSPNHLETTHVRELADATGSCISIYLGPWKPGAGDAASRQFVLDSVRGIAETLRDHGVRGPDIEDLVRPILELADEADFNQGHTQGWAIFRSPATLHFLRGPSTWTNRATVAGRFDLLPLLAALSAPEDFWLIALTHNGVRLMRSEGESLVEQELPAGVPAEPEADQHTGEHAANRVARRNGSVHFGVNEKNARNERHFRDFCAAVSRGVEPLVRGQLVLLAGTKEVIAAFRDVAPTLANDVLVLSPDGGFSAAELLERARAILTNLPLPDEQRVGERLKDQGEREVHSVLRAAAGGRVGHLFVESGASMRGNVDLLTDHVPLTGEFESIDDDLYNAAAVETLRHGGQVWCVPPERMPAATGVVAELRY